MDRRCRRDTGTPGGKGVVEAMALPARRTGEPARWDPFRELDDLHDRFSRLLDSAFDEGPLRRFGTWSPAVDIEETDDAFVVEAELPGVKAEDVSVELRDNQLSIHGEVKDRERSGVLRRQTRRTGQFDYRVSLPGTVDSEKVDATLKDGVLRLEVRKTEEAKPRRIEITGG
jgi:HSP20 family protein